MCLAVRVLLRLFFWGGGGFGVILPDPTAPATHLVWPLGCASLACNNHCAPLLPTFPRSPPVLDQAIAAQHTAAAEAGEEEVTAMRAAIEANAVRAQRLRKQRQDLENRLRSATSTLLAVQADVRTVGGWCLAGCVGALRDPCWEPVAKWTGSEHLVRL